jgi:hypothetical protein
MTTGLGLVVAVGAVWSFNYCSGRLEGMDLDVEGWGVVVRSYLGGGWGRGRVGGRGIKADSSAAFAAAG